MLIACAACHRQYDVGDLRPGSLVRCRCGEACEVPEVVPRQAEMLCCSRCGGALERGGDVCPLCKAAVDPEGSHVGDPCPECFTRAREGARYCGHCGVEFAPEAVVKAVSDRGCPRCKGDLLLVETGEIAYHECPSCAGIWLDHGTLRSLVEMKRAQVRADPDSEPALTRKRRVPRSTRYGRCPVCKQYMKPQHFGRSSGVLVDICGEHGMWFDPGELEQVAAFVSSGGLEAVAELRSAANARRRGRARAQRKARKAAEARARRGGGGVDLFDALAVLIASS